MAELKRAAPRRQQVSLFRDKFIVPDFVVEDGDYIILIGDYEIHMSRAEADVLHRKIHSEIDGNVGALRAHRARALKEGDQKKVEHYDREIAKAIDETKRKTAAFQAG